MEYSLRKKTKTNLGRSVGDWKRVGAGELKDIVLLCLNPEPQTQAWFSQVT